MVVRKSALTEMPEPFRRYVADHFKEKTVLGIDCMIAELHCFNPRGSVSHSMGGWPRGMAPCHSVDLGVYGEIDGKSLNEWVREKAGAMTWLSSFSRREGPRDGMTTDAP